MGGQRLELVGGGGEGQAGDGGDARGHHLVKADGGVQAGADCGAALGQLHQQGQGGFNAGDPVENLRGIAGEFLAQGNRGGILGMGAADLDDVLPGFHLHRQRGCQVFQRGQQAVHDLLRRRDVHGGGIGVV